MKRFIYLIIAVCAISCSMDGSVSKLSETDISLTAGDSKQLQYKGKCRWSSDEPLIASVEDGLITANRVGITYINANSSACRVEVCPKYTTYIEPFLEWGAPFASFESAMIDGGCIELKTDNSGSLWIDETTNTHYMCLLKNKKVTSTLIMTSLNKLDICTKFLLERYVPIGYADGYGVFTSIDKSSGITISYQSKYDDDVALWVLCVPLDTRVSTNDIIKQYKLLCNE